MRFFIAIVIGLSIGACDSAGNNEPTTQKFYHLAFTVDLQSSGAAHVTAAFIGREHVWTPAVPHIPAPDIHTVYFPQEYCAVHGSASQVIYPAGVDNFYSLWPDMPERDPGYSSVVNPMQFEGYMYLYSGDSLYKAVQWSPEELSFFYQPGEFFADTSPPYGPMFLSFDRSEMNFLSTVEFSAFAPVNVIYPSADMELRASDQVLWQPLHESFSDTYIEIELESLAVHDEYGFPVINHLKCAVEDDGTYELPPEVIDYLGAENPIKIKSFGRHGTRQVSFKQDIFSVFTKTRLTTGVTWPCSASSELCI